MKERLNLSASAKPKFKEEFQWLGGIMKDIEYNWRNFLVL